MSTSIRRALGPAIQGERMEPYEESWDDFDGVDLSLGGYTGSASWRVNGGTVVTRALTIAGQRTTLAWLASDYAETGLLEGELSITDGGTNGPWKRGFARVILPARGTV